MTGSNAPPQLYGLVLAGGHSTRMQRDKAALTYHGRTQLERAVALLRDKVERVFVSVRPDQATDPIRAPFPQIVDRQSGLGPIAGILAAQATHPEAAWLIVACDLPFLDEQTLSSLIGQRDPQRQATAYRSSYNGLPEPLCSIFEPGTREALEKYVAGGRDCPRKFLINADVRLLKQPNRRALDNINTPDEYGSAVKNLAETKPAFRLAEDSAVPPPSAFVCSITLSCANRPAAAMRRS